MRYHFAFIVSLLLGCSSSAPAANPTTRPTTFPTGEPVRRIEVGGKTRSYVVHLPPKFDFRTFWLVRSIRMSL